MEPPWGGRLPLALNLSGKVEMGEERLRWDGDRGRRCAGAWQWEAPWEEQRTWTGSPVSISGPEDVASERSGGKWEEDAEMSQLRGDRIVWGMQQKSLGRWEWGR